MLILHHCCTWTPSHGRCESTHTPSRDDGLHLKRVCALCVAVSGSWPHYNSRVLAAFNSRSRTVVNVVKFLVRVGWLGELSDNKPRTIAVGGRRSSVVEPRLQPTRERSLFLAPYKIVFFENAVQDLYKTGPTQEARPRSCRFDGPHAAT